MNDQTDDGGTALTARDKFAIEALRILMPPDTTPPVGILSTSDRMAYWQERYARLAEQCYWLADVFLAARKEGV